VQGVAWTKEYVPRHNAAAAGKKNNTKNINTLQRTGDADLRF